MCRIPEKLIRGKPFFSLLGLFLCLLILILPVSLPTPADSKEPQAIVLTVKGAIGPAVAEYIEEGLTLASTDQANVVIVQMDTPGGLDLSMRAIIKAILTSPTPVISYISPDGSRAASAGTYILYASHIAAMSPATNLGAATPIQIGGLPGASDPARKPTEPTEEKETTARRLPTADRLSTLLPRASIRYATLYGTDVYH